MSVIAIIPARLNSSRLPGKVLLSETGKPLVVHVCEQASKAESVDRVVVAADSQDIIDAVESHGFEAVMTSTEHTNGTSRLAEAADILGLKKKQHIINVQGDEPEIEPQVIQAAYGAFCGFKDGSPINIGTVVTRIVDNAEFENPNIVKAVMTGQSAGAFETQIGRALYFSRSPVPYPRVESTIPAYRHVGIYAYTVGAIHQYLSWEPSPLETTESLEQLRWLAHREYTIYAAYGQSSHTGIDTPEQYRAFVERQSQ